MTPASTHPDPLPQEPAQVEVPRGAVVGTAALLASLLGAPPSFFMLLTVVNMPEFAVVLAAFPVIALGLAGWSLWRGGRMGITLGLVAIVNTVLALVLFPVLVFSAGMFDYP